MRQNMTVTRQVAGKPLAMRLRLHFRVEGILGAEDVQEIVEVKGFSSGL